MAEPSAVTPDLIVHNAVVHTVDPQDRVAEAVAIASGRIVGVGGSAEMLARAGAGTRRIDLQGATVVPGFVDAHPHLDSVGARLDKPAFGNPDSIEQVLAVIRAEAARVPAGEWIVCNPVAEEPEALRYPDRLAERRWPTRHDLDRAAPAHRVYIEPPSLVAPGAAIMNSAAMAALGIGPDTPMPEGVRMELGPDGRPNGVFLDYNFPKKVPIVDGGYRAETSLFPGIPPLSPERTTRAVASGLRAFNATGVTAIYEGHGIPAGPQRAYLDLWQRGELTVRTYFVISYPPSHYRDLEKGRDLIEHTSRYAAGDGFGDHLLRFGGLGFSFDSAAAMGACLMREPYLGALGRPWNGVQLPADDAFQDILLRCARAGLRVQVQCSGGAAIDKVLAAYRAVNREIPIRGKRWTIQHCQFPSAQNMADCRELGVIATTTTNFLWLYGSVYLRSFGEALSADAIPFRSWLDAGVTVCQCTDGRPIDTMRSFWQMLARRDAITGRRLSSPAQALTRQEALRAYTLNGAMAAFWDRDIGSIETGKFADLAVLSQDILSVDQDAIPDTRVLATLLAGQPVHDTGVFA